MHRRICVTTILAVFFILGGTAVRGNDFTIAQQAFEQGHYTIAEAYFKAVVLDAAYRSYAPDALYYLTRIYETKDEFLPYMNAVNEFLGTYGFDDRCPELMHGLLEHLCDRKAYRLAFEYVMRYEYLVEDGDLLNRIGYGLFENHDSLHAARVLARCPLQDTTLILQAALSNNAEEKRHFYDQVEGVKGILYTVELLLETGDTVSAYDLYQSADGDIKDAGLLYRYAKASLLFDTPALLAALERLHETPGFGKKAAYLRILARGGMGEPIVPDDEEECRLFVSCCTQKVPDLDLPEDVDLDSILTDSAGVEDLAAVRQDYPGIFYVDSLYCEALIRDGRIRDAFEAIKWYAEYPLLHHYVRFVQGLDRFSKTDYAGAVRDLLLSQNRGVRAQYTLARASALIGRDPLMHYETVLGAPLDSAFRAQVQKELIRYYYDKGMYAKLVDIPYAIAIENDTLHRYYLYSLAHTGSAKKADSLALAAFGGGDNIQADHYGAYLVANKAYKTARFLYDSLFSTASEPLPVSMQYSWALMPLLQGDIDSALVRFNQFTGHVPPGRFYYLGMFKSATIHYLREEYDSAAYYYDLASNDDSLAVDAMQNQLVCLKKSAEWRAVIEVAGKLLRLLPDEDAAELYFEYGYAQLRYGDFRNAIINFQEALKRASSPEYHFWLGETYLAKGDFMRALYQYRTITYLFPKDEMWTPTAWYKIGIALEFMEEFDEARKIYEDIIKKRGAGDTWGIESQKRLDLLE